LKLAFKIQYKGTHYSGFQSQKNANSIQDELIRAFKQISVDNLQMNYSGRTDKGVHALGQVFDIVVSQDRSDMQWINGLNSNLPNDISVVDVDRVEDTFHSRFDAIDRTYSYLIFNSPSRNVLLDDFYYWEQSDLDIDKMNEESQCLIGKHNFSSFRSLSCGSNNPERDIKKIEINKLGNIIEIKITANAFLQNMVRIIVGTLLEIGKDQIKTSLREILESKDRNSAGITINPRGLIFLGPNYENITKLNPAKSPLIRI
jgi:tRNA pseudouridine38-40 synthase|tara:strand:- start:27 stop:803 length:777 start_codon:yes stop_codon:yes gene_type:complete